MAKFFQNNENSDSLFDGRILGGRQYSEHPYEGKRGFIFIIKIKLTSYKRILIYHIGKFKGNS